MSSPDKIRDALKPEAVIDHFSAIKEANRRHRMAAKKLEANSARIWNRIREIVVKGSRISGRPTAYQVIGDTRCNRQGILRVQLYSATGEGHLFRDGSVRFPVTWLSMEDSEWMTKLRVEVEQAKLLKDQLEAKTQEEAIKNAEQKEREILAFLQMKYSGR